MRCKECDYPLWNLRARQCPECGRDFRPSEFDFVCNSVKFCCPHCDQSYYGTGERGALVPKQFACVSCGQPCDMDDMVLRPADGVREEQTAVDEHPWMTRTGRGAIARWFRTVGQSMVMPGALGRAIANNENSGAAWRFALATMGVIIVLGYMPAIALFGIVIATGGGAGGMGDMVVFTVVMLGVHVGVTLLTILLWALSAHGVLLLTGEAGGRLTRTFEVILYSSGTTAGMAVPCVGVNCGGQVLFIWWIVSACIMLASAHRVHGGRAILAALAFPVVSLLIVIALYAWLIVLAINAPAPAVGRFPPPAAGVGPVSPAGETRQMAAALQQYAFSHNDRYPTHALELSGNELLLPHEFVTADSLTLFEEVPTPSGTLDELLDADAVTIRADARLLAADLPTDVAAYRFGDYVFTYSGIPSQMLDPALWVVIQSWDPDANMEKNDPIHVGTTNGAVISFSLSELPQRLIEQNQVRSKYGLVPLPDPFTVLHRIPPENPDSNTSSHAP